MSPRYSRHVPEIVALVGIFLAAVVGISIFNLTKTESVGSATNHNTQNVQNNNKKVPLETASDLKVTGISWKKYVDTEYAISFEAPNDWNVGEFIDGEVDYRELDITNPSLALIVITKDPNPERLSPKQWFAQMKSNYDHEFTRITGETEVNGNLALILGQSKSCRTSPMIMALFPMDNSMFTVTQYERSSRAGAFELKHLLETLSINEKDNKRNSIPDVFFQYPIIPTDLVCQ